MGTKISDLPVTGVLPADAVFPLEYGGANYSVKASDLGTGGSGGGSSSSGTTSAILPFAHARIFTNNAGTGIGMSWGAYNNGYVEVTFDTAQPDTDYYVVTDRETYDQHLIDVDQKTISGFRTKWVNSDNSLLPPGTFGGMLTVYGSTPTIDIGGGSGPRAYASFNGSAGAGIVVTQMAGGANQSLFVKSDGSYWAMGSNGFGQFGNGTNVNNNGNGNHTPEQILAIGVTQIAAGQYHSLFLKSDGSLHAMGRNNQGQLGDGSTTQRNSPVLIVPSSVTQIAGGGFYSLFLKTDGSLWAMGANDMGQFGDGTAGGNETSPVLIVASSSGGSVNNDQEFVLGEEGEEWLRVDTDGNLGVGTDNPGSKLHINDVGNAYIEFSDDGQSRWKMGNQGSDDRFVIYRDQGVKRNVLEIDDSTDNIYLNSNVTITGNLQIDGTTTTVNSTTLTVDDKNIELAHSPNGQEGNDGSVDGGGITLKSSAGDKTILWNNANDSWQFNQNIEANDGLYVKTDTVRARDAAGLKLHDDGGNGIFVEDGGNVGIGFTNTAGEKLDVNGNVQITNYLKSRAGDLILVADDANTHSSSPIRFMIDGHTADDEKMRLTHDGKLAIGVTSTNYDLEVNSNGNYSFLKGGLKAQRDNLNNSEPLIVSNYDLTNADTQTTAIGFGLARDSNQLKNNAGLITVGKEQQWTDNDPTLDSYMSFSILDGMVSKEKVRIDSDGKVGIGTDIPYTALEVSAASNVVTGGEIPVALRISHTNQDYGNESYNILSDIEQLQFWSPDASHDPAAPIRASVGMRMENDAGSKSSLTFGTHEKERMTIDANGNVGIGTPAPDWPLDVAKKDGGVQLQLGRTNTNVGSVWMGADSNGFHLGVGAYDDGGGITTNPNGFTVDTNGNVGIGINPEKRLDVSFDENNSTAADYRLVDGIRIINTDDTADSLTALNFATPGSSIGLAGRRNGADNMDLVFFAEGEGRDGNPRSMITLEGATSRLGVNIETPQAQLHVSGDAIIDGPLTIFDISDDKAKYTFTEDSSSGYITDFNMDDTGLTISLNSTSRDISFATNSTTRFVIGSDGKATAKYNFAVDGNADFGSTNGNETLDVKSHDLVDGGLKLAGTLVKASATELNKLDGATVTTAEINVLDGGTSATATTLVDADRLVVNDNGTMKQVSLTNFETFFESALDDLDNVTSIGKNGTTLTVQGHLTVQGTTTHINSTTVDIDDKNIELGAIANPTDAGANGGGITLKGATDKTIIWDGSNSAWEFNQHVLPSGDNQFNLGKAGQEWKDLYINGTAYLDAINLDGTALTINATELNQLSTIGNTSITAVQWGYLGAMGGQPLESFTETSHTDVVVDGDFTSQGFMKRGATAGSYSIVADNSANWNTAHGWGNHASAGYATTDTHRAIHDTPINGATTTSISSNWAFDNVKTAVPAGAVFTDTQNTYSSSDFNLAGLSDTTIGTPANGQFLKYDGSKWINDAVPGGVTSLAGLSDTTIGTPANGEFLKYNGTKWVPASVTTGGGAVSAVANGANNRIATFSSSDALYGETGLTFDGTTFSASGPGAFGGNLEVGPGVANFAFIDLKNPNNDDYDIRIGQKNGTTNQHTLNITAPAGQTAKLEVGGVEVLTGEVNDLSTSVTWANVPDANIMSSSVTQHLGGYLTSVGVLSSHSDVADTAPTNGQVLKWNAGGGTWEPAVDGGSTGGGTPAGTDNMIQFNSAGAFGASADLTLGPPANTSDGTENMLIVGASSHDQEKLRVNGHIFADGDVTANGTTSDMNLKKNIGRISNPLQKIKRLNGFTFDWNEGYGLHEHFKGKKQVGVSAQDVEEVMPELVVNRANGSKAVKYDQMIPLLIEGMKEQQKQIANLEAKLNKKK